MDEKKRRYMQTVLNMVTSFAQLGEDSSQLPDTALQRGYGAGGSDAINAQEAAEFNITPAEFTRSINFIEAVQNLLTNQVPEQAPWASELNKTRQDI